MHIITDRTLTMYSLHDTCEMIVTASLHREDNPGCSRVPSKPTPGFSLYLLTPRQCDDIGGGVLTLGTPNSSCSYHLRSIFYLLVIYELGKMK